MTVNVVTTGNFDVRYLFQIFPLQYFSNWRWQRFAWLGVQGDFTFGIKQTVILIFVKIDALFQNMQRKCISSPHIFQVYISVILVDLHTYITSIRFLGDNISNSFASNGYSRYNEQDSQVNAGQVLVGILSSNGSHVPPKDDDRCQGIQETVGLKEQDDSKRYKI